MDSEGEKERREERERRREERREENSLVVRTIAQRITAVAAGSNKEH